MAGIKLSPSSLNLFVDCPRCFWFAFRKKITRPSGPFPSLPTGMDSVIKKYFDTYRTHGSLPPILKDRIPAKLAQGLPKTLYFELSPGAILYGRPDEYLEFPEQIFAPLDHKTRASAPKELLPVYQNQMDIYDLLLRKNKYQTRNKAFLVYYYPGVGELHKGFPFHIAIKEVKTDPEHALKLFEDALKVLKKDTAPQPGENCAFCGWLDSFAKIC